MKALIEQNVMSHTYSVWFYRPAGADVQVARLDEHGYWQWDVAVDRGHEKPTPSLTLEWEMLEQLVATGGQIMPPDRAQGRHLDDAIATRDRLLAMVELTWRAS